MSSIFNQHIPLAYFKISPESNHLSWLCCHCPPVHGRLPELLWQPMTWMCCCPSASLHSILSPAARTIFSKCNSDHPTPPPSPGLLRDDVTVLHWSTGLYIIGSPLTSHPSGLYSDAICDASYCSFLHSTLLYSFVLKDICCLATNYKTVTFPPG